MSAATSEPTDTTQPALVESVPTEGARSRSDRAERLRLQLRRSGPVLALVFGLKLLLLAYGGVITETFGTPDIGAFTHWLTIWNGWDATNYQSIAEFGYQRVGQPALYVVFLPGYPLVVRIVHDLLPGDFIAASFIVSTIASGTAALLLAALVRHETDGDEAQSLRAVWFLLIFPTAYFLHIPYTESLFLSLLLGAFLAARTGHWATAGVVGALAAATRINGLLLIPALAVEAFLQYRTTGRPERSWWWIGAIALGTAAYLFINASIYGDPLHFQAVQEQNWGKHLQDPFSSVKGMIETAAAKPTPIEAIMEGWSEVAFLAVGLVAGLVALWRSRPSFAVWTLLNVLLFASTSWIQSTPRYAITLFPIFLLLAQPGRRTWVTMLVSAWSLMLLAWFSAQFVLERWAF